MSARTRKKEPNDAEFKRWLEAIPATDDVYFTMSIPISLPLRDWLVAVNVAKTEKESIGESLSQLLMSVDWDPITDPPKTV